LDVGVLLVVIVWGSKSIVDATVGEYWKNVAETVFTHVCEKPLRYDATPVVFNT